MKNTKQVNLEILRSEKFLKWVKETPKEELKKLFAEAVQDFCIETLEEKDRSLNLTGKCKKCYDYLTEIFVLNYINGKSMFDVIDDTMSGKFYNTWLAFLGIVYIIVAEGTVKSMDISEYKGIKNIIDDSGISRKNWMELLYQLYENGTFDK